MNSSAQPLTLRDDWQERRAFLARSPGTMNDYVRAQLRVLEYLLHRYADDPAALQPAQFWRPRELYINQRAVLVHHHLGQQLVAGVKSSQEAEQRIADVVQRMSAGKSTAPPENAEEIISWLNSLPTKTERRINNARAEETPSGASPPVGESSEERAGRELRFRLADDNWTVRLRAIYEVGETGDLNDIGLLMDLLAFTDQGNADQGNIEQDEREMLTAAIEKISGLRPRSNLPGAEPVPDFIARQDEARRAAEEDKSILWGMFITCLVVLFVGTVIVLVALLTARAGAVNMQIAGGVVGGAYVAAMALAWWMWHRARRRWGR